jgi:hypothetical protein
VLSCEFSFVLFCIPFGTHLPEGAKTVNSQERSRARAKQSSSWSGDPEPVEGGGGLDPEGAEGEFIALSPQGENVLGLKQCPNGLEKRTEKMKGLAKLPR